MKGLVAAEAYFPKMETIFTKMGVPPELTRLTLVESSFNLRAYSRVGAAGVWQFMPRTGKEFLTINPGARVDERLSPLKSTVAAAKLLKRHYQMLGDNWVLATISYNHGFRGLREFRKKRHISQNEVNRIFAPCSSKGKLGWASRNYYAEFLAVILAEAYHDVFYGQPPAPTINPIVFEQVRPGQTAMSVLAEKSITMEQFRFLNPDVKDLRKPLPKGFWIALPGEKDNLIGLTERRTNKGRSG
jgi:membrane-bound lytic murein transglycosylase D